MKESKYMTSASQREQEPRVTILTVAEDAGVSASAVSKVLRNAYGVSDTLRNRVMASIEKLDYRPSVAARGMRGKTWTIGILLIDISNPFLHQVIGGVNETLKASRYRAMIGLGQAEVPLESALMDSMADYRMDGLILVAPEASRALIESYAAKMPIVAIGHYNPATSLYDTVNGDDRHGAKIAVEALIGAGYTDIMMISSGDINHPEAGVIEQREIGYSDAMLKAGFTPKIDRIAMEASARDIYLRSLLSAKDRPRALFCWSDLHGIHVINLAKTMGINVPGELAIVGYDNSETAALPLVDLASIDQRGNELGRIGVELLLSRIAGRNDAEHCLITPYMVYRASI